MPKRNLGQRLDHIDKAIVRFLIRAIRREASTSEIAKEINVTTKTAHLHLIRLYRMGYVSRRVSGAIRDYKREGTRIKAERSIMWRLRYKD